MTNLDSALRGNVWCRALEAKLSKKDWARQSKSQTNQVGANYMKQWTHHWFIGILVRRGSTRTKRFFVWYNLFFSLAKFPFFASHQFLRAMGFFGTLNLRGGLSSLSHRRDENTEPTPRPITTYWTADIDLFNPMKEVNYIFEQEGEPISVLVLKCWYFQWLQIHSVAASCPRQKYGRESFKST